LTVPKDKERDHVLGPSTAVSKAGSSDFESVAAVSVRVLIKSVARIDPLKDFSETAREDLLAFSSP
jgi:hypothetical protein